MEMHLIESFLPTDAIGAALASQFAIAYTRTMDTTEYSIPNEETPKCARNTPLSKKKNCSNCGRERSLSKGRGG
jgi:molybdenum cofactor biosynthesis enzyme MoaA